MCPDNCSQGPELFCDHMVGELFQDDGGAEIDSNAFMLRAWRAAAINLAVKRSLALCTQHSTVTKRTAGPLRRGMRLVAVTASFSTVRAAMERVRVIVKENFPHLRRGGVSFLCQHDAR